MVCFFVFVFSKKKEIAAECISWRTIKHILLVILILDCKIFPKVYSFIYSQVNFFFPNSSKIKIKIKSAIHSSYMALTATCVYRLKKKESMSICIVCQICYIIVVGQKKEFCLILTNWAKYQFSPVPKKRREGQKTLSNHQKFI
jgi:hypothetical protein